MTDAVQPSSQDEPGREDETDDAYEPPRLRRVGTLPASTGMAVSQIGLPDEPQK